MTSLERGNALFLDCDLEGALECYNEGLAADAGDPELLNRRCALFFQQGKHLEALADANKGLVRAPRHPGLLMKKGRVCFEQEEYESAAEAFKAGLADEKDEKKKKNWRMWIRKCDAELEDDDLELEQEHKAPVQPERKKQQVAEAAAPAPKKAVRREWFQTDSSIVITLFAKGVQQGQLHVECKDDRTLHVVVDGLYECELKLLAEVRAEGILSKLFSTKVEITLPKKEHVRWTNLEAGDSAGPLAPSPSLLPADAKPAAVYPSSSRKHVNWDKLVAEEEEEELKGEDALNKVFKDIFARGTDEQKKAMMKSFTESSGTVLSTNWDDVGTKKVEISPPDGLEVKSWSDK